MKVSVCQCFVLLTLQVDIELSFTTQEDVRKLIENMIQHSWPSFKEQITLPFPSMTYHEAMIQYGSDKPDTRYNMKVWGRLKNFTTFIDLCRVLCGYIRIHVVSKSPNLRLVLDWFRLTADHVLSPYKNITDKLSNSYNLLDPDMILNKCKVPNENKQMDRCRWFSSTLSPFTLPRLLWFKTLDLSWWE